MPRDFLKKGLTLFLKRQTNIISAAFIIMATIVLSQLLGLVRQRLLASIFGASSTLGVYLASSRLPDFIFQLIIAGALSSAFIPVFSEYLSKDREKEGQKMAMSLLVAGLGIFIALSIIIFIFAIPLSRLIAPGFSYSEIELMSNLTRIIILGEILFIIGSFLSAVLQSYNHFFIPGIASAFYNLGIIIGILLFSDRFGIYSAPIGVLIGAFIFIIIQAPVVKSLGFSLFPVKGLDFSGVGGVVKLMWPRSLSMAVAQIGGLVTLTIISLMPYGGRNYVIFDYAQTLNFALVVLVGQSIAQASFPILSREKEMLENFKATFLASFMQIIYLVLPASALFLVLRIPLVRLIFGAAQFDWAATVLTGRTLGFFSISIAAQALLYLVGRAFYALHDSKTPLIVGGITNLIMILLAALFVLVYKMEVDSVALAYSVGSILDVLLLFFLLDKKTGGLNKKTLILPISKIFLATIFTGFALYIPIKILDQLVFDTTHTINLILLTGISFASGLLLYVFLTWLFKVKEAETFILVFKKVGNWKEVLGKSSEVIDGTKLAP